MLKTLVLTLLVVAVQAYPSYKSLIPNGFSVPNPCGNGYWRGVGHVEQLGSGPLNPFGAAFRNNGLRWDRNLCLMDSDGDGKTNGEELGDPTCQWSDNNHIFLKSATGHPGICEPVGSAACMASGFQC